MGLYGEGEPNWSTSARSAEQRVKHQSDQKIGEIAGLLGLPCSELRRRLAARYFAASAIIRAKLSFRRSAQVAVAGFGFAKQ
jgi:hypothetical protein